MELERLIGRPGNSSCRIREAACCRNRVSEDPEHEKWSHFVRIIRKTVDERYGDRLWFLVLEGLYPVSKPIVIKCADLRTIYSDSACSFYGLQRIEMVRRLWGGVGKQTSSSDANGCCLGYTTQAPSPPGTWDLLITSVSRYPSVTMSATFAPVPSRRAVTCIGNGDAEIEEKKGPPLVATVVP